MNIDVKKYRRIAIMKGDENSRLISFLKTRDEEEVDEIFIEAHNEVFSRINCIECMNCCKVYSLNITGDEAERISKHVGINLDQFKALGDYDEVNNSYNISRKPCVFLKGNKCSIEECKPESCLGYPATDREGVLGRLISILDRSLVCPAVYEIIEYVKEDYRYMNEIRPLPYFFEGYRNDFY